MRQGVVFDLDGVLVLSEHLWEEGWDAYAAAHGGTWTAADTRHCQGLSVPEWGVYLAERSSGDAADAAATVTAHVIRAYGEGRVRLLEGAADTVADAAAVAPVGLASSAPRAVIDVVMRTMGIGRHFAATVSSAEVPRGKPYPDVYLEAIRRLGVDAAGSIGIEDSSNGVRAAAAAGLTVIAVAQARYPLTDDARVLAASCQDSLDGVGGEIRRLLAARSGIDRQAAGGRTG
jgi:HAD superfamily hydrolase (TIGR01509 family)